MTIRPESKRIRTREAVSHVQKLRDDLHEVSRLLSKERYKLRKARALVRRQELELLGAEAGGKLLREALHNVGRLLFDTQQELLERAEAHEEAAQALAVGRKVPRGWMP